MAVSPISMPTSRSIAIEIPNVSSPGGGAERTTRRNLRSSPYPTTRSQPSTPNLSHTLDGMVLARSHSSTTTLDDFVLNVPRPSARPSPIASVAFTSPKQRERAARLGGTSTSPARSRDSPPAETSGGVQAAAASATAEESSSAPVPPRAGAHRHHGGCGFMEDEVAVHQPTPHL